ncbi:diaminopimelate epimerase [Listeria cossartiae subsp. cayugensis]|uniref:Diaminopimelate epimerase n=1 Tax=Listeria cossartiae subsp. cayugensis TaxID=2713505 RepID=A0ABU2IND2_9LIST|nr:diaminopimelate epimerase [Listeria cossartiae]MDT0049700.1 diaminopimelate epimerase [Listeria cossartiae subsp. cayugensis]MDT0066203.1 diaminopimelate epimerase [Listeria cossartiae subsp. cayugensis]MDT0080092.1 diaminopimelate epimerase [Listeria cossartiae subsp. cayugensis]MDT0083399.1 diaminopimelate epimerase [Listeria cossartiae subsp. cayugensis]MDT0088509.1 diaminopimelate epimerase [Listeria cossartiae subsp. cayugensis]
MATIHFTKVHGSQNDFFIVDEEENQITAWSDAERADFAIKLCDRKHSLGGADGILYVTKSNQAAPIGQMQVVNSDGSIASMCGNGLRTVARYLLEKNGLSEAKVETMKATLDVKKATSLGFDIPTYQVEISPVKFNPESLPMHVGVERLFNQVVPELDPELAFSAVSVPNPHLITFVDQAVLDSDKQEKLASYLNSENPYFPDGVNVSFVKRLRDDAIYVRTFERGVGFTNACGTAMSACSLIKKMLDNDTFETPLNVYNDGGRVQVTAKKDETGEISLQLIGNATFVSNGSVRYDNEIVTELTNEATSEQAKYQALVKEVKEFLKTTE